MGIDGLDVAGVWQPPINQVYPRISRSEYDLINVPLICIACLTAGVREAPFRVPAGGRDGTTPF